MRKRNKIYATVVAFLLSGLCLHGEEILYGSNEAAGNYIEFSGSKLYYEVYGQGEALILLHGGLGSISGFNKSIAELSQHYRVYAYDRNGHGRSHDNGQPFDYKEMAIEAIGLMDALDIPEANLVGYSDGGVIGIHMAMLYPQRVTKLVAIGANVGAEHLIPSAEVLKSMLDPESPAGWVKDLEPEYRRLAPEADFSSYIVRTRDLWTGNSYPPMASLQTIEVPILLVYGDRDSITLEHSIDLYRSSKSNQLCIIPNADHFVFSNHAAITNQLILDFCRTR